MERFCSDACCNESYLAPPQHNEPGRVGQYDRPPECPTSYSSSIELREVGSGQPVQRLLRHGVCADANNNNTTPEGVVARVLESFTDQDRHEYVTKRKRHHRFTDISAPSYERQDWTGLHSPSRHAQLCSPAFPALVGGLGPWRRVTSFRPQCMRAGVLHGPRPPEVLRYERQDGTG